VLIPTGQEGKKECREGGRGGRGKEKGKAGLSDAQSARPHKSGAPRTKRKRKEKKNGKKKEGKNKKRKGGGEGEKAVFRQRCPSSSSMFHFSSWPAKGGEKGRGERGGVYKEGKGKRGE